MRIYTEAQTSQWWTGCYLAEQRTDFLSNLICKQRSRKKQTQNKTKSESLLQRRGSAENALSRGALFPGKPFFSGFRRKRTASVICVSIYCCEFLCIFPFYSEEGLNLNSGIWWQLLMWQKCWLFVMSRWVSRGQEVAYNHSIVVWEYVRTMHKGGSHLRTQRKK